MKVRQLLEHKGSLEVDILQDMLEKGPVMFASRRDGELIFNEIYNLERLKERFASTASKNIAGKMFSSIEFRAPGYLSWHKDPNKRGIGDGWGNGSSPIVDEPDTVPELYFTFGKVFPDRPPMHVVYTWKSLGPDIKKHFERMSS